MSQGQYVATRPFPTTHRQYEIGDMIDTSRITSSELNAGVTSGAIEPAKFIDTAARLAALNPVLGPGVHAYETDTGVHKIGTDGVTRYNSLSQVGNGTYVQHRDVDPRLFGTVDTTGGSDSSAAALAAIADAQTRGCGVAFPPGRIRIDSQVTFTDTGGTNPKQNPIRLYGVGRFINSDSVQVTDPGSASTILDLRYSGGGSNLAKIQSKGMGLLEMDHLTLTDMGTSSNPFVKVSRTTPDFHHLSVYGNPTKSRTTCDQDAFVFGGLIGWSTHGYGGTIDSAYEGYGAVALNNVFFDRIRTCATLQASANSLVIRDCTVWQDCGGGATDAAFVIDPGTDGGNAEANLFDGNLIEMVGYTYGFKTLRSTRNVFSNNNFWDDNAGIVAHYWFSTGSAKNLVWGGGQGSVEPVKHFKDDTGNNVLIGMTGDRPYVRSSQGLVVDNNAGYWQRDSGGTPRKTLHLGSGGVLIGDVDQVLGAQSHIVQGASNGVLRFRLGSTDAMVATATDIKAGDGAWNGVPFRLGTNWLWVDGSGRLRIKAASAPTSDTDGTIVGTQS